MSATDIEPRNLPKWLAYVDRKREQAGPEGDIGRCERGHYDCSPVWNGTCSIEVQRRLSNSLPENSTGE